MAEERKLPERARVVIIGGEVEAAPGAQGVDCGGAERLAVMGVGAGEFRQGQTDRPSVRLAAALVEHPEKQRNEAVENGFRPFREFRPLVMLDNEVAGEIGHADRDRGAVDMRGQHRARLAAEAHVARRAAADGGAEFPLGDEAQRLQRRQTVGDDGAAEFGCALEIQPRRRLAGADQPQQRRQTRAAAFQQAGTANAPLAAAGGVRIGAVHRSLGVRRDFASEDHAARIVFPQ